MSGYPFQSVEHDASVSVAPSQIEDGAVEIEFAAGSCVTIAVPLWTDEARGLLAALAKAIDEADK